MAIDDCNLTLEEREIKKVLYYKYIDNYNSFWYELRVRYRNSGSKRVTQEYINIVKSWLFDCPHEYKVIRNSIHFGNYERDGWCYYYDWVKGQFGQLIRQILEGEELESRRKQIAEKQKKKEIEKCKQFGLNPDMIGTIFQNKEIADLKVRWDGIALNKRKFPIKFYDLRENSNKLMRLDYFKEYYYEGVQK